MRVPAHTRTGVEYSCFDKATAPGSSVSASMVDGGVDGLAPTTVHVVAPGAAGLYAVPELWLRNETSRSVPHERTLTPVRT